jgi:hypothetical protein
VIRVLLHASNPEAGLVATRGSPRVQRFQKTGDSAGGFPFHPRDNSERRGLPKRSGNKSMHVRPSLSLVSLFGLSLVSLFSILGV